MEGYNESGLRNEVVAFLVALQRFSFDEMPVFDSSSIRIDGDIITVAFNAKTFEILESEKPADLQIDLSQISNPFGYVIKLLQSDEYQLYPKPFEDDGDDQLLMSSIVE
jgi:hypothetical protein